jgi:membrane protein implicated in regulation of membrane protease activity
VSRRISVAIAILAALFLTPQVTLAYVGPGTGLSAIGSFLALLMAVVLTVVGFFWLPLKRILKARRQQDAPPQEEPAPEVALKSAEQAEDSGNLKS